MIRLLNFLQRWGLLGSVGRVFSKVFNPLFTRVYAWILGISIGPGTIIYPGAKIRSGANGEINLGAGCVIHSGARILAYGGSIVLGDNCTVNPYSILYGHGGLLIGNRVLIAAGTIIIPANHKTAAGRPISGQGLSTEGIKIGDDVWLGSGVRVLDGSIIESDVVVAAGAVVAGKRLEAGKIYGGVPAKFIAERKK